MADYMPDVETHEFGPAARGSAGTGNCVTVTTTEGGVDENAGSDLWRDAHRHMIMRPPTDKKRGETHGYV